MLVLITHNCLRHASELFLQICHKNEYVLGLWKWFLFTFQALPSYEAVLHEWQQVAEGPFRPEYLSGSDNHNTVLSTSVPITAVLSAPPPEYSPSMTRQVPSIQECSTPRSSWSVPSTPPYTAAVSYPSAPVSHSSVPSAPPYSAAASFPNASVSSSSVPSTEVPSIIQGTRPSGRGPTIQLDDDINETLVWWPYFLLGVVVQCINHSPITQEPRVRFQVEAMQRHKGLNKQPVKAAL